MVKIKNGLVGIFSGFINGLLGSGGGTIVVPALEFLEKVEAKKAHATAIAVILPLSVISVIIYFFKGSIPLKAVLFVGAGSIVGSLIGAFLLNKIPAKIIKKVFGIIIVISAVRMFFL